MKFATAFLDESEPRRDREPGTYLIAAAILPVDEQPAARARMLELKPKTLPKAHWHQQPDRRQRTRLVEAAASLPGTQLVVVRVGAPHVRPERRRRLCLERMAFELGELGVQQATFESRGPADDSRDRALLQTLRQRHVLTSPMRFDHIAGPAEPLLWVPDILCGAVNEARNGNAAYVSMLPNLRVVVVDGR